MLQATGTARTFELKQFGNVLLGVNTGQMEEGVASLAHNNGVSGTLAEVQANFAVIFGIGYFFDQIQSCCKMRLVTDHDKSVYTTYVIPG